MLRSSRTGATWSALLCMLLGIFLTFFFLDEICCVTPPRFGGNCFTNGGLGDMLAAMSATNKKKTSLPPRRNMHLSNMEFDPCSIHRIFFVFA